MPLSVQIKCSTHMLSLKAQLNSQLKNANTCNTLQTQVKGLAETLSSHTRLTHLTQTFGSSARLGLNLTIFWKFYFSVMFNFCIAGSGVVLGPGAQVSSSSGVTSQAADGLLFILEGICPHGLQSFSLTPCFPWQMEHFFFSPSPSTKSGCLGSLAQAKDPPGSHPLWRLLMDSARSWHTGWIKGLKCLLFQV